MQSGDLNLQRSKIARVVNHVIGGMQTLGTGRLSRHDAAYLRLRELAS